MIDTRAFLGMSAMALATARSIRAVMENCPLLRRIAATTLCV